MVKELNERLVRFSGWEAVRDDYELGQAETFVVRAEVVKTEEKNNQDGTKDRCFILKVLAVEPIETAMEGQEKKDEE